MSTIRQYLNPIVWSIFLNHDLFLSDFDEVLNDFLDTRGSRARNFPFVGPGQFHTIHVYMLAHSSVKIKPQSIKPPA